MGHPAPRRASRTHRTVLTQVTVLATYARRLLTTFLFLIAVSTPAASADPVLKMATGNTQGVYYAFGVALQKAVEKTDAGFRVELIATEGASENVQLLLTGSADLALVQADTAYECKQRNIDVQGVASLYTEVAQILVSQPSDIREIDDLQSARIVLGAAGSGSITTARRILNTLGIYRGQYEAIVASATRASELLDSGEADAAFIVSGVPSPRVRAMGQSVRLMGMSLEAVAKLIERYPFLVASSVPAGTYEGQNCPAPSVGLRALLVAAPDCPHFAVQTLLNSIFSDEGIRRVLNEIGEDPNVLDIATKGMPIDLHPAAAGYYRYRMLWARILARWAIDILLLLGVLIFGLLVFISHHRFFLRIRKNVYLRILASFICVYLVSTVAIHFFERNASASFASLPQAFWSTIVYVLSGIEEREPGTVMGRGFSILLLLANISLMGLIVGEFAATLIRKKEAKMPSRTKGSIIICNWNARGDRVVKELHGARKPPPNIVVLTDSEVVEETLRSNHYYDTVTFVRRDPQLHCTLTEARVYDAESIVILADEDSHDPDAISALIALAISSICKKKGISKKTGKGPHIVAEAVNHRKKPHLKDAGVDEVICPADYGLGVLAQSAVNYNLSDVYDRLLTYSKDTNEIYILDRKKPEHAKRFPEAVLGKTFAEAAQILSTQRDSENPSILIGLKVRREGQDDQIIMNPRDEHPADPAKSVNRIGENDALFILAFHEPDLSGIATQVPPKNL